MVSPGILPNISSKTPNAQRPSQGSFINRVKIASKSKEAKQENFATLKSNLIPLGVGGRSSILQQSHLKNKD